MATHIAAADLQPLDAPGDGWYIIEAAGEFPTVVRVGDEKLTVTQRLTTEALERVAEAGVPPEGLLIDRDHLSRDNDKPTEAMGWGRELAATWQRASSGLASVTSPSAARCTSTSRRCTRSKKTRREAE